VCSSDLLLGRCPVSVRVRNMWWGEGRSGGISGQFQFCSLFMLLCQLLLWCCQRCCRFGEVAAAVAPDSPATNGHGQHGRVP